MTVAQNEENIQFVASSTRWSGGGSKTPVVKSQVTDEKLKSAGLAWASRNCYTVTRYTGYILTSYKLQLQIIAAKPTNTTTSFCGTISKLQMPFLN